MKDIAGKTAVVTGAGGGIGRSIALALADHGANVVITDIDGDLAEQVAAEVAAKGVGSLSVTTDVSKLEQVEALASAAYDCFGSVEILINNAGVTLRPFRASWDTTYEDWQWMMGINFWGVLHGHHVFVPRMRETEGEKHIVNTSSMASLLSIAGHSSYSASKAAVDGLSNAARLELATQGIGVSILHPGTVRTRIVTSERLRDESVQSEKRGVRPWTDYVTKPVNEVVDKVQQEQPTEDPDFPSTPFEYITPNLVGEWVVQGIIENKAHILTHPAPLAMLEQRSEEVLAGQPVAL